MKVKKKYIPAAYSWDATCTKKDNGGTIIGNAFVGRWVKVATTKLKFKWYNPKTWFKPKDLKWFGAKQLSDE